MLTADIFQDAGLLQPDVAQKIVLRQAADLAPIYSAILAGRMLRRTVNEKVEWGTQGLADRRTQVDNDADDYDDETTEIDVANGSAFYVGALVLFEATGEIGLVTAVAGDTITVERGVGTTAADDSVEHEAWLRNIGPAIGEGARSPQEREYNPDKHFNYVQTFRKAVKLSGRMQRMGTLTEDEAPRRRMVAFQEMLADFQHALLFGAASAGVSNQDNQRVTTMAGLYNLVTTNRDNVGGTMTIPRWHQFSEMLFSRGSRDKVMFAGGTLVNTIHALYDGKLRVGSGEVAVGLQITEVITPHGRVRMVYDQTLTGPYAGDGVALDMPQIELRHTEGGLLQLRQDVQEKDEDAKKDEWFAEHTVTVGDEGTHGIIEGVTGVA